MNFSLLIFLIFLSSCINSDDNCRYYSGELLRNYFERVEIKHIDTLTGAIYVIEDKEVGNRHFGSYSFYENGLLESYKFFGNDTGYSYNEEYDKNGGKIHAEGKPLVLRNIKDVSRDSIYISLYFSSINKIYDSLLVSINDLPNSILHLKPDTTYSNMLIASEGINVKGLDTISVRLMISFKVKCNSKINILKDSIFLYRHNDVHEFISKK